MTTVQKMDLVSVDDYLEGELRSKVKHEYLAGVVYAMAGARNVHNVIATNWLVAVGWQLRGRPCQPFNSDTKVRLRLPTHMRFYYPDAMIVCQSNPPTDSFQDNPVVVAEVMSDATRRIDEGEKKDAYFTIPSLTTYMLIETERPRVVVYRRTETIFAPESYQGKDATIELKDVVCSISLAELYERVDFTAASSPQSSTEPQ